MSEGLDIAYDAGSWQAICKVPYLSLADPAIRWTAENKPKTYAWWAIRAVLQASGRICRAPDDFGVTFLLDSSFEKLYNGNRELFPDWYIEALSWN
jgi:Rad3-related DNA helicase